MYKYTTDTNYFKEVNVIVPVHVQKEMHRGSFSEEHVIPGFEPKGADRNSTDQAATMPTNEKNTDEKIVASLKHG